VKYKGIFHGAIHAPDRLDLQAIEKSRTPETKGPLAEAVRGVLVCANTFADACLRTFVPVDGKFGKAWAASGADVTSLKDHQVVTVSGTAVANGKGESLLLADSVTVEGH
jgi:hypothetical protein